MGLISANDGLGRLMCSGILADASMGPGMRLHKSYTVVYVLDGSAYYRDAHGFQASLRPGNLIFVFPDLAHNYNAMPGGHWKQIYFMFDSPVFALWQAGGLLDPARPVHFVEPVEYWFNRLRAIHDAANRPAERGSPLLDMIRLQEVLAEALLAEEARAMSRRDLAWAAQVCTILEQESPPFRPLPVVARRAGLEYETFRKRFTRVVGMSPVQYRNRRIIDRACRLMQETALTNKEIAYRLGFCDEFHFSHRFKQITGRSPTQFRRTLPLTVRNR
jgi:AraC-like DNA-binding protein